MQQFTVPLSHLEPSKRNPRRVKPDRDAHRRLVALIRAHGLLHPLVVRPREDKPKHFFVIAGNRRLAALREIHRRDGDPHITCVLRKVDNETADALSLGENFGREPMHPLDEAEAFAKLARQEGKDAKSIASDFGVTEHYVLQRMKLATLAEPVQAAYREYAIDTGMAEAFSAVPEGRQLEVWKEVGGRPRHAEHVRNIIANDWIDASLALFDPKSLSESAVSQDLFSEKTLVERKAFLEAQSAAMVQEHTALSEDGWSEVVIGNRGEVQDRLFSMDVLPKEFDAATTKKLRKLESDIRKLESAAHKIDEEDEVRLERAQSRIDAIEEKYREIEEAASTHFSEATKAKATVFLILDPDGRVHREFRKQRRKPKASSDEAGNHAGDGVRVPADTPTSNDLSESQLAVLFTHQALCVREALHQDRIARKRILAMMLHEKVRSEALALRPDVNGTTLHATSDGFKSQAHIRLQTTRAKLDPFIKQHSVDDVQAYEALTKLSEKKLDELIDSLIAELITAHPSRPTPLVMYLSEELKVNVRNDWTPDAGWFSGFQKVQLAHLITELRGPTYSPSPEKKKSELVDQLTKLFADAAGSTLEDRVLADKLNRWLPPSVTPGRIE